MAPTCAPPPSSPLTRNKPAVWRSHGALLGARGAQTAQINTSAGEGGEEADGVGGTDSAGGGQMDGHGGVPAPQLPPLGKSPRSLLCTCWCWGCGAWGWRVRSPCRETADSAPLKWGLRAPPEVGAHSPPPPRGHPATVSVSRCPRGKGVGSLGERLRHQQRKNQGGVGVDLGAGEGVRVRGGFRVPRGGPPHPGPPSHLDGGGIHPDLAPGHGLVRPRSRVGAVELLRRVDVDGEVGPVPLRGRGAG